MLCCTGSSETLLQDTLRSIKIGENLYEYRAQTFRLAKSVFQNLLNNVD